MSNHRISGLANPTDADDVVTRRYVASRFQALSDVQNKKSKLDVIQNFLGVENNQVLIREYEIIDTDFYCVRVDRYEGRGITDVWFLKFSHESDDINKFRFIDIFTLKEYFFHLFEEPADDVTGLRIKQPGTYTIHFNLIIGSDSFSFELHTRDEIIYFSEHNPKHDINLEKGENWLLVFKTIPTFIRAGS